MQNDMIDGHVDDDNDDDDDGGGGDLPTAYLHISNW